MHCKLGSASLSQLAFPGKKVDANFQWEKSQSDNRPVKSKLKKEKEKKTGTLNSPLKKEEEEEKQRGGGGNLGRRKKLHSRLKLGMTVIK